MSERDLRPVKGEVWRKRIGKRTYQRNVLIVHPREVGGYWVTFSTPSGYQTTYQASVWERWVKDAEMIGRAEDAATGRKEARP